MVLIYGYTIEMVLHLQGSSSLYVVLPQILSCNVMQKSALGLWMGRHEGGLAAHGSCPAKAVGHPFALACLLSSKIVGRDRIVI